MYDVWYASVVATHDFLAESDLIEISVLVRRDYLPNHSFLVGWTAKTVWSASWV